MSAYSASAPVTASTMAPTAANTCQPRAARKPNAWRGSSAARIAGCSRDVDGAGERQGQEPQRDDRPEHAPDRRRAEALNQEQPEQDGQRHRHDIGLQGRGGDLQAFHRTEHRDRRRDHAVAIEQRGAAHPQQQQRAAQGRPIGDRVRGQRRQRQAAAFAAVVGAQDQHHVLQGHDQHQGPEDARHRADQVAGVRAPRRWPARRSPSSCTAGWCRCRRRRRRAPPA